MGIKFMCPYVFIQTLYRLLTWDFAPQTKGGCYLGLLNLRGNIEKHSILHGNIMYQCNPSESPM